MLARARDAVGGEGGLGLGGGVGAGATAQPLRMRKREPCGGTWINDAGHRSCYCGLTTLATVHVIVD